MPQVAQNHERLQPLWVALAEGIRSCFVMNWIMDDLMVGFSPLAELARRHEQRLDRIEGR